MWILSKWWFLYGLCDLTFCFQQAGWQMNNFYSFVLLPVAQIKVKNCIRVAHQPASLLKAKSQMQMINDINFIYYWQNRFYIELVFLLHLLYYIFVIISLNETHFRDFSKKRKKIVSSSSISVALIKTEKSLVSYMALN